MNKWGLKEWNAREWVPLVEITRNERYIKSQLYKYYVEIRKYDAYIKVEDVRDEIRVALKRTLGLTTILG